MIETQSGIPSWIKTQVYNDFGFVLRFILVAKNDEKSIGNSMDFERIPWETPGWAARPRGGKIVDPVAL